MKRAKRKTRIDDSAIAESGPNIFADMDLPDAEELHTKVRLAVALYHAIKGRKLKQAEAAKILGVAQPKVSALMHGKLDGFSVQKLIEFLTSLNRDVDIVIRPRPAKRGAGRITVLSR